MHGLFVFAVNREWMLANLVAAVDLPRAPRKRAFSPPEPLGEEAASGSVSLTTTS